MSMKGSFCSKTTRPNTSVPNRAETFRPRRPLMLQDIQALLTLNTIPIIHTLNLKSLKRVNMNKYTLVHHIILT